MKLNVNTLELALESLLGRLFEKNLVDGSVTLVVELTNSKQGSGKSILVKPTRLGCAPIIAFCENGSEIIYLTVGQNISLEVPLDGKRYTTLEGV